MQVKNVAIILGLLAGAYGAAIIFGTDQVTAGRIGISAVFLFTSLGHFAKTDDMMRLLPAGLPQPRAIVLISGGFELIVAVAVLFSAHARSTGLAIEVFLFAATPLNIYGALQKVDFGGHGSGPRYLAIRLPLQIILMVWTYWFTLR
jgi:uncharacterized membrane protein